MKAPILTPEKQSAICAILSVGGTRALAAKYVGCHKNTVLNTAKRDADFRERLNKCETNPEILCLKTISTKFADGHFDAAKWALERLYPDRYARRKPNTLTTEELNRLIKDLVASIMKAIKSTEYRRAVRRAVRKVLERGGHAKNGG